MPQLPSDEPARQGLPPNHILLVEISSHSINMDRVTRKWSSLTSIKRAYNRWNRWLKKALARAQAEAIKNVTRNTSVNFNVHTLDTPLPSSATSPPAAPTCSRSESPTPSIIILDDSPYSFSHNSEFLNQEDPFGELRDTISGDESPPSPIFPFNPEELASETGDASRPEPEPEGYQQRLTKDQFRLWILNQFPPIHGPLPDGVFCIGPGPVDYEELRSALLEALPDSVIP